MDQAIFCISLDFELHWGGFEKWPLKDYNQYFLSSRTVIPKLLKAFEVSGVRCSWATVGLLMHSNRAQLTENLPSVKPSYVDKELSAYHYLENIKIGATEADDPFHYAHDLIRQIVKVPGQELASHSFAHYYCNEPGQSPQEFEADALSWNKAAEKYDVKPKSLVFPRNQFNNLYLQVCKKVGVEIVRTNPVDWWWQIDSTQNESKWKRLNRGMDAYFNIGGKTSYPLSAVNKEEGVWLLPASRLLRPYNPNELSLNKRKIKRIKNEMTRAAELNECYHLWWHPHNFGKYPKENLAGLIEILNHYQILHEKFGMKSLNMGEIAERLRHG